MNVPHVLLLLAGVPPAVGMGLVAVAALAVSGLRSSRGAGAGPRRGGPSRRRSSTSPRPTGSSTSTSDRPPEHLAFLFPPLVLVALAASRRLRSSPLGPRRARGRRPPRSSNLPAAVLFRGRPRRVSSAPGGRREAAAPRGRRGPPRRRPRGLRARPGGAVVRWCATELFDSGDSRSSGRRSTSSSARRAQPAIRGACFVGRRRARRAPLGRVGSRPWPRSTDPPPGRWAAAALVASRAAASLRAAWTPFRSSRDSSSRGASRSSSRSALPPSSRSCRGAPRSPSPRRRRSPRHRGADVSLHRSRPSLP